MYQRNSNMAAPTLSTSQQQFKTLKGQKQNKRAVKNVLISPYTCPWPQLTKGAEKEILKNLHKTFTRIDIKREKQSKKRQLKDEDIVKGGNIESSTKVTNLRHQVVVGVNAVTRSLERGELRLVLLDGDTRPLHLVKHLVLAGAAHTCPVLVLGGLARQLAPLLGVTSLTTTGFKKLSEGDEHDFDELVEFISGRIPLLDIPWLHPAAPQTETSVTAPSNCHTTHTTDPTTQHLTSPTPPSIYPVLPPVDFNNIYVHKSDSTLTNGKVKPQDFGSLGFVAFEGSSEDELVACKSKKTDKKKGTKRRRIPNKHVYNTTRIGKIKSNETRPSPKIKKMKT